MVASDESNLKIGTVIRAIDLKSQKNLNGKMGVIQKEVNPETGRYPILLSQGSSLFCFKACNLEIVNLGKKNDVKHEVMMFWPTADNYRVKKAEEIIVNPIENWPTQWTLEREFLKTKLGWTAPDILGGITSQGQAKPDFQMYYDAKDITSPKNVVAKCIASLLPEYEVQKVQAPQDGFRGACILVYSPMNCNGVFQTSEEKRWSLEQMQQVLFFQTTVEAKKMYKSHDNPMHRAFGATVKPSNMYPSDLD